MADSIITIGITCYREGEWLRECWESVLAQTNDQWEAILVMDGGADDTTQEVFNSIEHPKLLKISLEENIGPFPAHNLAVRTSTTPLHLVMDADDQLPKNSVEMILATYSSIPNAAFIYGDVEIFGAENRFCTYPKLITHANVLTQRPPGAAVYRKDVWESLGGFTDELSRGAADHDFYIGLIEHGYEGVHCGGVYYRYRRGHSNCVSSSYDTTRHINADIMINRHPVFFSDTARRNYFRRTIYAKSALGNYRVGNDKLAASLAKTSICLGQWRHIYLWLIMISPQMPKLIRRIIKNRYGGQNKDM